MNPAQAGLKVRPYLVGREHGSAVQLSTTLAPVAGGEH